MQDKILKLLQERDYVPSNVATIRKSLRLKPANERELEQSLKHLEQRGEIAEIKGSRYIIPSEADLVPGRIQMTRQGRGFLIPDDEKLEELAIPAEATGTALHEDRVLVRREGKGFGGRAGASDKPSGSVVRVLERRRNQFVGNLQRSRQFLFVVPDDPRIPCDIYVPEPRDLGRPARVGDKVVVELQEWQSRHSNPEGEIIEVLGPPGQEGVDMLAIIRQHELPLKFPRKVLQEVKNFGKTVTEQDVKGRIDCRKHDVITIDPIDAKDFDDAFYLERAKEGNWKLWIHIADVSNYVAPGSSLDIEAKKRGNSTYLVDRVIPMLPEALSNELCSLKPKVDRLTKCVEFLLDNRGEVLRSRCYGAVIHSKRRFSYQEAFEALKKDPGDQIEKMLHHANVLAQKIRKNRFKGGALELDFPENKIYLDEKGKVSRIEQVENDISHQLIEEFMLLANEAVAEKLKRRRIPTLYRIHEPPDPKRLNEYRDEVKAHHIPCGNLAKPVEVQKLLKRLSETSLGKALKIGFLKALMRARYSTAPVGHYGLAKENYAHFTSPIRRYADLIVHRSLFEKARMGQLKDVADHISLTERNSADAERESHTVKLHAHLNSQIESGNFETYKGMVSDIRNFGFFVDVSSLGLSGLVPLSVIKDEFFVFHAERRLLVGQRSGRKISVGDTVEVQIQKVDSFKKQVDFCLKPTSERKSGRGKKSYRKERPKGGQGKRQSKWKKGRS